MLGGRCSCSWSLSDFVFTFTLFRTDQDIQTYTIAVINALFLKAPEEKRQVHNSFSSRVYILLCIISMILYMVYLRVFTAFFNVSVNVLCIFLSFLSNTSLIKSNPIKWILISALCHFWSYHPNPPYKSGIYLLIRAPISALIFSPSLFHTYATLYPAASHVMLCISTIRVQRCAVTLIMNDGNPQLFWDAAYKVEGTLCRKQQHCTQIQAH